MDIAIVGAGLAGLATAKHLSAFGHRVSVFERAPDVGGVWSATRRYPGIETQSPKEAYHLHDLPMPAAYPERPAGAQVQAYLAAYVDTFGLGACVHLGTEVVDARPVDRGWEVCTRETDGMGRSVVDAPTSVRTFAFLVVCNGAHSTPFVPDYKGRKAFEAAGGEVYHSSAFVRPQSVRDKAVLVVGYGKSACDVAAAASEVAGSTTMITRSVLWKIPARLGGLLNYKYALNTRVAEALYKYADGSLTNLEKFFHSFFGRPLRSTVFGGLGLLLRKQLGLDEVGLVPRAEVDTFASEQIGLVTEGFFEKVRSGALVVKRDSEILELVVDLHGRPAARLNSDIVLPADVVICGTGFQQPSSFLPPDVTARCQDARGNWMLYRHILPLAVPRLAFVGYNATLFCAMTAEMGALWLAAALDGLFALPPKAEQRRRTEAKIAFLEGRGLPHAHGTCIVPWSMHTLDELVGDLDVQVSALEMARQYLLPVRASAYAGVEKILMERKARGMGVARHSNVY